MAGQVLVAAPRSFCAGVVRAIAIVNRALDDFGSPVYVRRQIVHNSHVIDELSARGAVFVQELEEVPEGAVVVLSAHGVAPAVRDEARRRSLRVIDAVCPLVAKVHQEAKRYARDGYDIFLIGHAEHEEVIGTVGQAPERIQVIAPEAAEFPGRALAAARPAVWLSQTTLAVHDVAKTADRLREAVPWLADPPGDDVCYASQNRQAGVKRIAPRSDLVLVVGSPNSSNTVRLAEVALAAGAPAARLVDRFSDLRPEWLSGVRVVGVTSGASAPEALVQRVLAWLAQYGFDDVEEVSVVTEDIEFELPGPRRGRLTASAVEQGAAHAGVRTMS